MLRAQVTGCFFWTFCDDYLELVRERAYNREGKWSDQTLPLPAQLKRRHRYLRSLSAPFLPFVTEEVPG